MTKLRTADHKTKTCAESSIHDIRSFAEKDIYLGHGAGLYTSSLSAGTSDSYLGDRVEAFTSSL